MKSDRLERIESKLDAVTERLHDIDKTLLAQHDSLKDHIKRTNLLERKMEPVEKHVQGLEGVVRMLKVMATVLAILAAWHALVK